MVIFDKTGTLTRGSPAVSGFVAVPGVTDADLIAQSAAVEANSEHPLAEAIVKVAKRRAMPELKATNFAALPGRGAKATVDGKSIEIGGPRLLTEAKIAVSPVIEKSTTAWESGSKILSWVEDSVIRSDNPDVGVAESFSTCADTWIVC